MFGVRIFPPFCQTAIGLLMDYVLPARQCYLICSEGLAVYGFRAWRNMRRDNVITNFALTQILATIQGDSCCTAVAAFSYITRLHSFTNAKRTSNLFASPGDYFCFLINSYSQIRRASITRVEWYPWRTFDIWRYFWNLIPAHSFTSFLKIIRRIGNLWTRRL